MILAAIILFCAAAVLGLSLAVMGLRYRRGSPALGWAHAGIAIVALVLLGTRLFHGPIHILYDDAALVFVFTLAGGVVLLALREGRKPPSGVVVGIHGATALTALVLLVVGYLRA